MKTELVSQEFVIFWGKEGVNGGKLPFYYVGRPAADADTVYDQYYPLRRQPAHSVQKS